MKDNPNSFYLENEFSSRISGKENIDYSIPKADHDALMAAKNKKLNEEQLKILEKYFTDIDEDEVIDFYEQYEKEINRMKDNRSGGMRAASKEDGKKLIRLFGQDGEPKTFSTDTVDTNEDSLDSYLALAVKRDKDGNLAKNPLSESGLNQSVTLSNVIKIINLISITPSERGGKTIGGETSISKLMRRYRKEQSKENETNLRDSLSQSNYDKIRNYFLDALRKTIVDYMGSGDKSILHGMKKIEPYNWVKARVADGN